MAQAFFNPSDVFNLGTGANVKWEPQTHTPATTQDRAQWLKKDGDEGGKRLYNAKTTATCVYTATDDAAPIPKFGDILNGWHVDSVQVVWSNTAFCQMTVQGHKHGTTSHPACNKYTGSLSTIGTMFGCPSAVTGMTIPAGAGIRSVNYTLTGTHLDEPGSSGDFLAGQNHDGNETVTCELCDTGTITAAAGWDLTNAGGSQGNTQAETASATVVKHIAHDVVTGS